MSESVANLIERAQRRSFGYGIGTAHNYLGSVSLSTGEGRMKSLLELADDKTWNEAIDKSRQKLVYRDKNTCVIGGLKGDGSFGTQFKQMEKTPNAILDFACVMTSVTRDRDRDILEPQGARIDEKMPLLWQHMPFQPIGKYVRELQRDQQQLAIQAAIADNMLGRDAAVLVEFGGLRISHGFSPNKWEPIDKDDYGWHILDYEVYEVSLVSIPSNPDAQIMAFSRGKLFHPLVKSWAQSFYENRPDQVTVPELRLNSDSASELADKVAKAVGAAMSKATETQKKCFNCGSEKGYDKTHRICIDCHKYWFEEDKTKALPPKLKADDEPKPDEEPKEEEKPKPEEKPKEEEKPKPEEGKSNWFQSIKDALETAAGIGELSREGVSRMGVLSAMMDDVMENMDGGLEKIAECSKNYDLAGLFEGVSELADGVYGTMCRMQGEIAACREISDLPEAAGKALDAVGDAVDTVVNALGALTGKDVDDGSGGGEGEEEEVPKDEEPMPEEERAGDDQPGGNDADSSTDSSVVPARSHERERTKAEDAADTLAGHLMAGKKLNKESRRVLRRLLSRAG